MRPEQQSFVATLGRQFYVDRPKQSPSDWAAQHLRFDEPDNRGPLTLSGREYMREPMDWWADPASTDAVQVFGSQTGKTGGLMAGAAWLICNEPSRIFWVMPTRDTAKSFSRTRWQRMLETSDCTKMLIPVGAHRHNFATFQQHVGGAVVDMVWSNSPAALASIPARVVILDEVDKFNEGGAKEANAVNLAEQRTKNFATPKRCKTSTPTIVEGLIWQEFLKTDQRRRFVPCPHCGKLVVLIWSKQFTVLPLTGNEAQVRWDKEARREGGGWDLDRVEKSARFECPHCGGHILDAHKTRMDRDGRWQSTAVGAARGYRGWHLPSLYAASAECNVGKLAVKFLQAKQSLQGLQGFINGDLAEPYLSQDRQAERIELITSRVEITAEWQKALTVDCQQRAPHFWFAARAWNDGDSQGFDSGSLDTWDDIRAKQKAHGIADCAVCIDSGFGAKSDAEVYRNCSRFCEIVQRPEAMPIMLGWMPAKGMPGRKRWKDSGSGLFVPWYVRSIDPYLGTSGAGMVEMSLFEFSGDFFKDILANLRAGKAGCKWEVLQSAATEEYWRHLDAESKVAVFSKQTGLTQHVWLPRSKHWPNHMGDCEVMQVALASFFGWLKIEEPG